MRSQTAEIHTPFLAQLLREALDPVPAMDEAPWAEFQVPVELWNRALTGPLLDFAGRPGKEMRARLVELSWVLGGGRPGEAPPTLAYLVEMLHAGSLIVDDIEDDAEMRRGEPALHRRYGMPTALNAGNWLYFWPLYLVGRLDLSGAAKLELFQRIAATLLRCHQGQALDLTCRSYELSATELPVVVKAITALKTGALMELSAAIGAIAAGANAERVAAVARFGREVGIGLQMLDDLGGLTADHRADKGLEDLRGGRATWPWAWLAERGEPVTLALAHTEAKAVSKGDDPTRLIAMLRHQVAVPGRAAVNAHLDGAIRSLRAHVGPSKALGALVAELARLRRSYG